MYSPDEPIPPGLPFLFFPNSTVRRIYRANVIVRHIGPLILYSVRDVDLEDGLDPNEISLYDRRKKMQTDGMDGSDSDETAVKKTCDTSYHLTTHPITKVLVCSCGKIICWHMFSVLVYKK